MADQPKAASANGINPTAEHGPQRAAVAPSLRREARLRRDRRSRGRRSAPRGLRVGPPLHRGAGAAACRSTGTRRSRRRHRGVSGRSRSLDRLAAHDAPPAGAAAPDSRTRTRSSSESTATPSSTALSYLLPASSPATTNDVFLLTLPETLAPSALSAEPASSRVKPRQRAGEHERQAGQRLRAEAAPGAPRRVRRRRPASGRGPRRSRGCRRTRGCSRRSSGRCLRRWPAGRQRAPRRWTGRRRAAAARCALRSSIAAIEPNAAASASPTVAPTCRIPKPNSSRDSGLDLLASRLPTSFSATTGPRSTGVPSFLSRPMSSAARRSAVKRVEVGDVAQRAGLGEPRDDLECPCRRCRPLPCSPSARDARAPARGS